MSVNPTAANPESAKQGLESMAQNLALFRDIMGGNVTEASIPQGMKDALSGIVGAFVGEEVIQQQLAENFPTIQRQIIAKLTDPNVAAKDNMLVQIINKMEPEQLDQMFADSPKLKGFIESSFDTSDMTVGTLANRMQLPAETVQAIADVNINKITAADLGKVSDENLIAIAVNLPYDPQNPEAGFGAVLSGLNEQLESRSFVDSTGQTRKLEPITLEADATPAQKLEAFNKAIDTLTENPTLRQSFGNAVGSLSSWWNNEESYDPKQLVLGKVLEQVRAEAPAAIQATVAQSRSQLLGDAQEIDGTLIKKLAQENPELIANSLKAPGNADALKDVITLQLLQNNTEQLLPFASGLMDGQTLGVVAGLLNTLSEKFPALGQLVETFDSMMAQVTDKLGLGNMFADLGGSEGPQQGSALRNHYGEAIDTRINVDGPPSEQRYAATGTGGPSM